MLVLIQKDHRRGQALVEALNAYEQKIVAIDLAGNAPGAALMAAYRDLDTVLQDSLRARLQLGGQLLKLVPAERRLKLLTNMAFASYTAMMMEGASWGARFSLTTQAVIPMSEQKAARPDMRGDQDAEGGATP